MSDQVLLVGATALVNLCVTWGTLRTQLAWLRRDVDDLRNLRDAMAARALKGV